MINTGDPSSFQNLISISDAAAMFRRPIRKNHAPHTVANNSQNNLMVDSWRKDLLNKVASNGKLPAATITPLWNLYVGGTEIPSSIEHYHLTSPSTKSNSSIGANISKKLK